VRADHPFPPGNTSHNYFEITIDEYADNEDNDFKLKMCVAVGLCGEFANLRSALPGWQQYSFAYHGDDGNYFEECGTGENFGIGCPFGQGDTVGCALDWANECLHFVLNGKKVGKYSGYIQRNEAVQGRKTYMS